MRLDFLYNTRLKVKLFCLIFALILIDQVLKLFILNNYEINQSKQIFSIISFTFVKNYGVAFSFLNNESFNLSIFTSFFKENFSTTEYFAFSLILAGGLGNFIDRINHGFVVDFIDISFNPYIFNLADSYVTIGILIYVFKSLIFYKK